MIIFEELVYQEALRRKLTVPPQQVKQAEVEFKKQFGSAPGISTVSEDGNGRFGAERGEQDQAFAVD